MTEAKKPRRGKWLRRLGALAAFLFLVVAFLPLWSKLLAGVVAGKVQTALGREVELDGLSISLLGSSVSLEGLAIKEDDGTTDFVRVESVDVDFELFALLAGKIVLDECTVDGVTVRVAYDEEGRPNFQSILDHLAAQPKEETEPAEELPHVEAKVVLSNVDVEYSDARSRTSARVEAFRLETSIAELRNVEIATKMDAVSLEVGGAEPIHAHLVPGLDGTASLEMKAGQLVASHSGTLLLSGLDATGSGLTFAGEEAKLAYRVAYDQAAGTASIELHLESSFARIDVPAIELAHLDALGETAGSKTTADLLAALDVEGWKGKVTGEVDLDRLGRLLGGRLPPEVSTLGGRVAFESSWKGEARSALSLEHGLSVRSLRVGGRRDDRPFELALDLIDTRVAAKVDLARVGIEAGVQTKVEGAGGTVLAHSARFAGRDLLGSIEIDRSEQDLQANLTLLGQVLAGLLPEGTRIEGTLAHRDAVTRFEGGALVETGSTELSLTVETKDRPKLPPLVVTGARDLTVVLAAGRPKKIDVRTFTLDSKNDETIRLKAAGSLDLEAESGGDLTLTVDSKLDDLAPYLDALDVDLALAGRLHEVLGVSGGEDRLVVRGAGRIEGLVVGERKIPRAVWNHDLTVDLADGAPALVDFGDVAQGEPLLEVDLSSGPFLSLRIGGSVDLRGEDPTLRGLVVDARLEGAGLAGLLDRPELTLGGHGVARASLDGSMAAGLTVDFSADFSALVARWKPEGGTALVDKRAGVSLGADGKVVLRREGVGVSVGLDPLTFRLADLEIDTGLAYTGAGRLTGKGGQGGLDVHLEKTNLDGLHGVFPVLATADVRGATVELAIEDFSGDVPAKVFSGRVRLAAHAPSLSLPKLRAALGVKPETGQPVAEPTPAEVDPAPAEEGPLVELTEEQRAILSRLVLDVQTGVDRIDVDEGQRLEDWKFVVAMNQGKADNALSVTTTARALPDGKLDVALTGDLSQAHPPFEVRHDVDLAYEALSLLPIDRWLAEKVPFPLLAKIEPADPMKMDVVTAGRTRWRGVDSRAVKRSVVSNEKTVVTLGAGSFDLGFPILGLTDLGALAGAVEEQIRALRGGLDSLTGKKGDLTNQAGAAQKAIADFQSSIDSVTGKIGPIRDLIGPLKTLANFDPSARKKIEEYEKQIAGYEQQSKELTGQKQAKEGELGRLQSEIAKVDGDIEKVNGEISEKQKGAGAGLDLDSPFDFEFTGVVIEVEFTNADPFAGGGLDVLARHPASRIALVTIRFQPENGVYPEIRGWSDLEGRYEFRLVPGQAQLRELDAKAPGLGALLGETGVGWSNEGFVPNPFK